MGSSVSVVIPCYRQAHFLRDAIESVLAQSHPAREVVVVDDGSPDAVRDIVAGYPDVRYVRQENAGLGPARNAGLALCTAGYVVFLDADDRLLPDALRIGAEAFRARPDCGFVWGRRYHIDAGGLRLPVDPAPAPPSPSYFSLLRANHVGPPAAAVYRRLAVEAVGAYWTERLPAEDWDLNLRLVRRYPGFFHGAFVAEYRRHGANMSGDADRMLAGQLAVLDRQELSEPLQPAERRALRSSRRLVIRLHDRETRLATLSRHTRARQWGRALWTACLMFSRHPQTIWPVSKSLVRKAAKAVD